MTFEGICNAVRQGASQGRLEEILMGCGMTAREAKYWVEQAFMVVKIMKQIEQHEKDLEELIAHDEEFGRTRDQARDATEAWKNAVADIEARYTAALEAVQLNENDMDGP
ncbi:hypothetical protein HJ526_13440 [Donghicola sp. C2-DW-16]|uniref:Uncharacterized protein n=1 Tax=Donghicola mangrovi TaxID=2729614 RepID=A0ABX2PHE6_9RHOB|nr:hypothetical protein [Donghicola mangrovi]NVO28432.1 hypothetical protein [Donghicola mangrovi]